MSKLFFDNLVVLEEVNVFINNNTQTEEEKQELWGLVDEIVHHRVFDLILGKLPKENHQEFLKLFGSHPHDEGILDYLKQKVGDNVEDLIRQEMGDLSASLLEELKQK